MLNLVLLAVTLYVIYRIVMAFYHWILRVSERNSEAARRRMAKPVERPNEARAKQPAK